ncbi:ribonuclease P protein component [Rhodopirellula sp. P2]|uniref:ribonuclease P protein component n=1 Tax=Rhodopirellula sp. P2 TaxID=2127060 RepID=UPI0023681534|nr:ribonuclease P protein component [Rhodopirellula sp. P2]WDQ18609.1 ribonuclease P protein component [Rhodopirellula sp. P2]
MSRTLGKHPLGFPKSSRVVRSGDFTQALRRGGVAANDCLVVFALPRDQTSPEDAAKTQCRLGVTIPKKTGNAVVRNRWKRLIREAYRLHQMELPTGFDYVIRPKKDVQASWKLIDKGFVKLVGRAVRRSQPSSGDR